MDTKYAGPNYPDGVVFVLAISDQIIAGVIFRK
jgi:hypothetical protein